MEEGMSPENASENKMTMMCDSKSLAYSWKAELVRCTTTCFLKQNFEL